VFFFSYFTEYGIKIAKEENPDRYEEMGEAPLLVSIFLTALIFLWPIYIALILFIPDEE